MSQKPLKDEDYPTTGHEWDGIREYDKPMPRWWLITFWLTIIWGIGFTIAYPAWPLFSKATPGLLGYSSREALQEEVARVNAQNAQIEEQLISAQWDEIAANPDLSSFALQGGAATFRTFCAQCHGSGAQGAKGYPNLSDDDWLWGGTLEDIHTTLEYGIRATDHPDTRYSEMPVFGGVLSEEEIADVVAYVRALSGQEHDALRAAAGAPLYLDNCSGCHGETGTGDIYQGAPNLSDAIWLFGGDEASLTETITYGRASVMPAWSGRITEAQIKQVTYYVHQLGGGE